MITIRVNVVGTVTDFPSLTTDAGLVYFATMESPSRAAFALPDSTPPHGFTVRWAGQEARSVVPAHPGNYEGGLLVPPLPDLVYGPTPASGLRVDGDRFMLGAEPFLVRGSTDFRLAECVLRGRNIRPILDDRFDAGANWLRVLSMKTNNTGWTLSPREPGYWDAVSETFGLCGEHGFFVEWVVFADTATIMPTLSEQQAHYTRTCELVIQHPHVLIELVNEAGHGTQRIDPSKFSKPAGILASHGSGLTDTHPVEPFWDWVEYHGRRMAYPTDARAAVAYSPYGFEENWPKSCPMFNGESAKPSAYSYNPAYSRLMGLHACCGSGGIFHHDAWNTPRVWTQEEKVCGEAFYRALGADV